MSLLHNSNAIDAGGYLIERSLRFNSADSTYLHRTPASASNQKTWTWSAWIKRSGLGSDQNIFTPTTGGDGSNESQFQFQANDTIRVYDSGTARGVLTSTQVFRDTSAWYHIVLVLDTTQATSTNRVTLYVNGTQITAFSTATYPTQNIDWGWNRAVRHDIGRYAYSGAYYFNGYMTEIHFIDGQALTPSSFGEIDTDTRVWKPKAYSGTYGTNGFFLKFADNSGTTAATLGKDSSGNGNNWTPNNFSVTAGAGNDSLVDSPTSYGSDTGAGGQVRGNYATLNPLDFSPKVYSGGTFAVSDGNLALAWTSNFASMASTIGVSSGKWYWEVTIGSFTDRAPDVGIYNRNLTAPIEDCVGASAYGYSYYGYDGKKFNNNSRSVYGATYTTNDVIGVALDLDAGTLVFYKNGVSQGTAFSGLSSSVWVAASGNGGSSNAAVTYNFGQRAFAYTAPSGFKALCTQNLPAVTINNPKTYMDIKTYTGNGGNLQIGEIQKAVDLVTINNSLRFRNNAYLNRTPASAGNRQTWTMSFWHKRGVLGGGTNRVLFAGGSNDGVMHRFVFNPSDAISFNDLVVPTDYLVWTSSAVFRDPTLWHHFVIAWDTTQGTNTNRFKVYCDGVQLTANGSIQGAPTTYPPQNYNGNINAAVAHQFFRSTMGTDWPNDGYLADVHFIDGTAHEPTAFGQFDANGYWVPKTPSGLTYGTNGFKLDFSDIALTSGSNAGLGKDTSGNANYWNTNNISVTSGSTYDAMIDTPTNSFATLNPLDKYSNVTLSNGNLDSVFSGYAGFVRGTIAYPSSGKWYWEGTVPTSNVRAEFGIALLTQSLAVDPQSATGCWILYSNPSASYKFMAGVMTSWGTAWVSGDIIGVAFDADAGTLTFYKNGALQGGGAAGTGLTGTYAPMVGWGENGSSTTITVNFGQRAFAYSPPAGFVALSENNVAEVTNDLEQPDLVWIKSRSGATNHMLFDRVRGINKHLSSNTTGAESTDVNSLIQFNKNGFYIGNNSNINTSASTYVAWMWKANGAGVSNNSGSIPSTVSASTTAGFSIVTYTANNGTAATVGHGLGAVPKLILFKNKSNTGGYHWVVYHGSLAITSALYLSSQAAEQTPYDWWNNTAPTPTVFSIKHGYVNNSTDTYVAYCFAEIPGYSKISSYTGNGSSDGPFVFTGFRPNFILIRRPTAGAEWEIRDSVRLGYNPETPMLFAEQSVATYANDPYYKMDLLANGFKLRNTNSASNVSGATFLYAAFAETPFKYALAR